MKIVNLSISNFRGIRQASIDLSPSNNLCCIIGPGDSTKSTLLTAISWVFWPTYNLPATDLDFYNCQTSNPISIEATVTDFPEEMKSDHLFGMYLRSLPPYANGNDDPTDNLVCITIRLEIDANLEPRWSLVKNSKDERRVSAADRKQLCAIRIGSPPAGDFVWGRNSILHSYIDASKTLVSASIAATRTVAQMSSFSELDNIAGRVSTIAAPFGVAINPDELHNRYFMNRGSISSSVGLFENEVPLFQKGTGTQLLLSAALGIKSADHGAILLIDEIETGLEPFRLRGLIRALRDEASENAGQVIVTTHSPVTLTEAKIEEVHIAHNSKGIMSLTPASSGDSEVDEELQKLLRSSSEAFLAKKIIVCEGKTEAGFIRGVERAGDYGFLSRNGAATDISRGGDMMFEHASHWKRLGYEACIIMDSDVPEHESKKDAASGNSIEVFDWDKGNNLEKQLFNDAPDSLISQMLEVAVNHRGADTITNDLKKRGLDYQTLLGQASFSDEERLSIGLAASKAGWFKLIDPAEDLGGIIFSSISLFDNESKTSQTLRKLYGWVQR